MIRTDGYDIELTSGDDLLLRIDLTGRDLPQGTQAIFTVKRRVRDAEPVIQTTCDASSEILTLRLTHEQTNLTPGTYCWDVRLMIPLEGGGYEVHTPMDYAAMIILEAVGSV